MRPTINKWAKFVEAQIPEAQLSKSEFHCTMIPDPKRAENMENKWQEETEGRNNFTTHYNR